jgi:hypothetical protein
MQDYTFISELIIVLKLICAHNGKQKLILIYAHNGTF